MYYVKRHPRKTRTRMTCPWTAHAVGRWRAGGALGGASDRESDSALSGRVLVRVVVRAPGQAAGQCGAWQCTGA